MRGRGGELPIPSFWHAHAHTFSCAQAPSDSLNCARTEARGVFWGSPFRCGWLRETAAGPLPGRAAAELSAVPMYALRVGLAVAAAAAAEAFLAAPALEKAKGTGRNAGEARVCGVSTELPPPSEWPSPPYP